MKHVLFALVIVFLWIPHSDALERGFEFAFSNSGTPLHYRTGGVSYNLKAGSGVSMKFAFFIPISETTPHRFELRPAFGFMYDADETETENSIEWFRVPLEVLYYYHNTREHFRIGTGPVYHMFNRLHTDGIYDSSATRIDNAWGWAWAIEHYFKIPKPNPDAYDSRASLGLRYTKISYRADRFAEKAIGDAVAITMAITFF